MTTKRILCLILALLFLGASITSLVECKHSWGEWKIDRAATDNSIGKRTRTCSKCGISQTRSYYPKGTLFNGVKNKTNEIKEMQSKLSDMGFLDGNPSGSFDKETLAAVKKFQEENKLEQTGVAFPETLSRLNALWTQKQGSNSDVDDFDEPSGTKEEKLVSAVNAKLYEIVDGRVSKNAESGISFENSDEVSFRVVSSIGSSTTWVIDGILYTFNKPVKQFTVRNLSGAMTIEPVKKGKTGTTMLTLETILQNVGNETLVVRVKNGTLRFLKNASLKSSAGKTFKEFDFTDNYKNLATKKEEQGGRITLRVAANVPKKKKLSYWKFDETRMYLGSGITSFRVQDLNVSKEYEPVFGNKNEPDNGNSTIDRDSDKSKVKATKTPKPNGIAVTAKPSTQTTPTPANAVITRPDPTSTPTPANAVITRPDPTSTPTPANAVITRPDPTPKPTRNIVTLKPTRNTVTLKPTRNTVTLKPTRKVVPPGSGRGV